MIRPGESLDGRVDIGHRFIEISGELGDLALRFGMIVNQPGHLQKELSVVFSGDRLHEIAEEVGGKGCCKNANAGIIALYEEGQVKGCLSAGHFTRYVGARVRFCRCLEQLVDGLKSIHG